MAAGQLRPPLGHRWDLTPTEAIAVQKALAPAVRCEALTEAVRTVAGADCAFVGRRERVLAAAVLCDARTMDVLAVAHADLPCDFPYVPGLLSFREAPAIMSALAGLPARPDLLMVDGQGLAHPRGLGIASHLGLLLDLPTIGAAKSRLCGQHAEPAMRRGSRRRLVLDGKVIGAAVRTRDGVRPMYVSVGHRITLDQAIAWVLRCARVSRLPQPTRLADQMVARMKKSLPATRPAP